jgi:general secretion pathway protein D
MPRWFLGGLIKQRNDKTYNGIPLLSRIPLLGGLFRTTSYVKNREELVILIRPSVTFTPGQAVRVTETENEALRLEPDLEQTIFEKKLSGTRDRDSSSASSASR